MLECALTIPTSVVNLKLDRTSTWNVCVSGVESVTHLDVGDGGIKVAGCPKLRELVWHGGCLSLVTVPCSLRNITALTALTLSIGTIDRAFEFPPALARVVLKMRANSFDITRLSVLAHLQELDVTAKAAPPVDLAGFESLRRLVAFNTPVLRFPTSLVLCCTALSRDIDFSALTRLTTLHVKLKENIRLTFPTQLRELVVVDGCLRDSNLEDVAVESFEWLDWTFVLT